MTTVDTARDVYASIEELLHWDNHYWLQRGSLEVEDGDLGMATNFLDQARSMAPGDRSVRTEYAYLLMKKAARNPGDVNAVSWFNQGWEELGILIEERGARDPYPYHVLGSQGLAWAMRANLELYARRTLLERLLEFVDRGVGAHPAREELRTLQRDIKLEWLKTAVRSGDVGA